MPRLLIRIKCEIKVPSPLSKISLALAAVNHSRCAGLWAHSYHIQWQRNVFYLLMFCLPVRQISRIWNLKFTSRGFCLFIKLVCMYLYGCELLERCLLIQHPDAPLYQDGMLPLTVVGPSLSIACFNINKPLLTSNEVGVSDMEMNVLPIKDELIRHTFVAFIFWLCLGTCCMSDGPD